MENKRMVGELIKTLSRLLGNIVEIGLRFSSENLSENLFYLREKCQSIKFLRYFTGNLGSIVRMFVYYF